MAEIIGDLKALNINFDDLRALKDHDPSKAAFARFLVRSRAIEDTIKARKLSPDIVDLSRSNDQGIPAKSGKESTVDPKKLKIGIIGAGISGLYTALLLQSQGIQYEILEANPDRIGGRLYTHYFGEPEANVHQYYDIGAMRYPDSPIMARTFKLFKETGTELGNYVMSSDNQPMRYNDITRVFGKSEEKWKNDPFKVSRKNHGPVPDQTVKNPQSILDDAYFPYRRKIKRALKAYTDHIKAPRKAIHPPDPEWAAKERLLLEELELAWQYLMQHDKFSLRDYLSFVENQDDETIHWLETINAGTGWFDQAFSENVLESLAFDYGSRDETALPGDPPEERIDWYYIKNGSYKLTENVLKKLKKQPETGKYVTGMKLVGPREDRQVEVHIKGEKPRVYDTVLCSTTFAAMQKMDLTGLKLPYPMKAAIRSLRYDPSTKVAIQFREAWWIESAKVREAGGLTGIKGGLGKTDMPLRTCVYPSYNIDDKGKAVLLCSYTWSSDSERIASMINPVPTGVRPLSEMTTNDHEPLLKEIMIDNLARLHSVDDKGYENMKTIIADSWLDHHAYDWSKDPYTCGGAFALYSPSQFRNMYPNIVRPAADSRFHVIGEAASAHHAWVAGALDSAARGVHMMLERFKLPEVQKALKEQWGEVGEVDDETAYLQVALGMLDREDAWPFFAGLSWFTPPGTP